MSNIVRPPSDRDQTTSPESPPNYIPWERIDRSRYEILHPEKAMDVLGMSSRTAHRKINTGELLYTTEKGAKRIVLPKRDFVSDPMSDMAETGLTVKSIDRLSSDNASDISADLTDRVLALSEHVLKLTETLADKDRLIQEKDQVILKKDEFAQTLNHQLMAANHALQKRNLPEVLDPQQKEMEALKALLASQAQELERLKQQKPWWRFW